MCISKGEASSFHQILIKLSSPLREAGGRVSGVGLTWVNLGLRVLLNIHSYLSLEIVGGLLFTP